MKLLALVLLFAVAYAKHEQYQGWKSYFVTPSDQGQLRALNFMIQKYGLDTVSKAAVGRDGVVLVTSQSNEEFVKELAGQGISYRIHANDVKAQLDIDDVLIKMKRTGRHAKSESIFDNYLELEEINAYLEDVAEKYPDLVTLLSGTSFEGRPINYLKIGTPSSDGEEKRVIIIDAGIHSREWIAPPTVLYGISQLVDELADSDLVNDLDWILLPVVNPDGYKYSHTTNRLWFKTRSTDQHLMSFACPGVDVNRNFDFYWNTFGTSDTPCEGSYAGRAAFSEKETQLVKEIIDEYLGQTVLYISLHSYGSLILYPWGHDGSFSQQAFALQTVGVAMANAIHDNALPHYPRYIVGNSALVTQQLTSGSVVDYAHYVGVPLSFNLELPGVVSGTRGYNPDPKYIEQIAKETWAGIVVGARRAKELYGDWNR